MGSQRAGYRIWAKGDRCAEDWDLRQVRNRLSRYQRQSGADAEVIAWLNTCEAQAVEAVRAFEARYQLGGPAR